MGLWPAFKAENSIYATYRYHVNTVSYYLCAFVPYILITETAITPTTINKFLMCQGEIAH